MKKRRKPISSENKPFVLDERKFDEGKAIFLELEKEFGKDAAKQMAVR